MRTESRILLVKIYSDVYTKLLPDQNTEKRISDFLVRALRQKHFEASYDLAQVTAELT